MKAPGTRATAAERVAIPPLTPQEQWRDGWEYEAFRADVRSGLSRPRKAVPPKYLYDATGAALFERICETPEYYPTRAELEILETHGAEIAALLGPELTLVELGSGSSRKTHRLLDRLERPRAYVPVDLAAGPLAAAAAALRAARPGLLVLPVCADFTMSFALPPAAAAGRCAVFFPGSTIGNLEPADAVLLMRKLRRRLPAGGMLVVGVDVKKDIATLERAYNDAQGLTAAFNRNLLVRIRRELEAEVDPDGFAHRAFYDRIAGRIEMHLYACGDQTLSLAGEDYRFRRGETLHTENSYKYAPEEFAALARQAGFTPVQVWHDTQGLFSVHCLQA
jgi:L-histidine Nalpha-methyltransferase